MDVNGTRLHLIAGEGDWRPLLEAPGAASLRWDPERSSVGLAPRLPGLTPAAGPLLTPEERRGAARDRYGSWYWIGEDGGEIRVLPAAGSEAGIFWTAGDPVEPLCPPAASDFRPVEPVPPPPVLALRGLAVTARHYLVAGVLDPPGLLVFDLHGGGPPTLTCWPEGVLFAPFDLEGSRDGGVWILDRAGPGDARLWRLDRSFRPAAAGGEPLQLAGARAEDFKPADGGPEVRPAVRVPGPLDLTDGSPPIADDPVAILELPDGSLLLLDSPSGAPFSTVHHLRDGAPAGPAVELAGALAGILDPLAPAADADLLGHDFAFLAAPLQGPEESVRGALYVAPDRGEQSFLLALVVERDEDGAEALRLEACHRFLPMRRFGGKALVAACGEVYYDFGERWLLLTEHPRGRFLTEGEVTKVLDSRLPGCRWHRLLLDGCIPDGGRLAIQTRASDDPAELPSLPWRDEPPPYRRAGGSEIPFHEPLSPRDRVRDGAGTWELLLQRAEGRHLELRLRLSGNGRTTPRVAALRVHYPRFSYLREYLPAVYRQDAESAFLLDRYLANVEGLLTELEGRIERAQVLFDPGTAPVEYLDWLAGWLGTTLDPLWDEGRRRLFLRHAPELFTWRGTPRGILAAVRLSLDPCPDASLFDEVRSGETTAGFSAPRLVEGFLSRELPGVVLGDPTAEATLSLTAAAAPWAPSQGSAALHALYRAYLEARYSHTAAGGEPGSSLDRLNAAWGSDHRSFATIRFPPLAPESEVAAADRRAFLAAELPFPYADPSSEDATLYRDFLARRHGSVAALDRAHGRIGAAARASFAEVELPSELPESGQELTDWIDFVSRVIPVRRSAHRFTVLVPTEPGEAPADRAARIERARRIVERERPAHTEFDVKPFWALFRVGAARIGSDTVLGEGSRFTVLVLGASALTESHLAEAHPWSVADRSVLGRDRLMES